VRRASCGRISADDEIAAGSIRRPMRRGPDHSRILRRAMRRSHAPDAPMPRLSGHALGYSADVPADELFDLHAEQTTNLPKHGDSRSPGYSVTGCGVFHAVYGDCRGDDRGACRPSPGADDATAL
jgi:hypothetical protein